VPEGERNPRQLNEGGEDGIASVLIIGKGAIIARETLQIGVSEADWRRKNETVPSGMYWGRDSQKPVVDSIKDRARK